MQQALYNKLRKIANMFEENPMSSPTAVASSLKTLSDLGVTAPVLDEDGPFEYRRKLNRVISDGFDYTPYTKIADDAAFDKAASDFYSEFTPEQRSLFRVGKVGVDNFDRTALIKHFGRSWLPIDRPMCNAVVGHVLQRRYGRPIMQNPETGRTYTVAELNAIADSDNSMLGGFRMQPVSWDEAKNGSGVIVLDPSHMGIRVKTGDKYSTFNAAYSKGLDFSDWGDPQSKLTRRPVRFFRLVKEPSK